MNKYENGKIYKIEPICQHDDSDIYIGSTTEKYLSVRLSRHKTNFKFIKAGKKVPHIRSCILFDKYGEENCVITLLELVNCLCKEELLAKERFYIQSLKCVNRNIPSRTQNEYYEDNKETIDDYRKKWRANNKEKIKTHNENFWERFKDSPDKRKYYNKEARKQYYQTTKDKDSQLFVCECGSKCWSIGKNRHLKSRKHLDFLSKPK